MLLLGQFLSVGAASRADGFVRFSTSRLDQKNRVTVQTEPVDLLSAKLLNRATPLIAVSFDCSFTAHFGQVQLIKLE